MSTMTDEQMKRVHDITYSTQDRMELAERIVALEELCESRKRMLEADDRDWCPMQLSGLARCEGPDPALKAENDKLRKLLSNALIAAGFDGRQYLDAYLREEEETNLLQELKSVGMDVGV